MIETIEPLETQTCLEKRIDIIIDRSVQIGSSAWLFCMISKKEYSYLPREALNRPTICNF
jgi:hypothetical protein